MKEVRASWCRGRYVLVAAAFLLVAGGDVLKADGWTWKGELGLESRGFEDDGESLTEDYGLGLAGRFEADRRQGRFRAHVRLFGRADAFDSGRDAAFVEQAWIEYRRGRCRGRAGAEMWNVSATEAFHPADVLNSRNLDSDLESFEKLGEPVLGVRCRVPAGELSVSYLPVHVDPKFPSRRSRLSLAPPGWRVEDALWVDRDGGVDGDDFSHQWSVGLQQSRGPVDFDVHVVRHSDRSQPVVLADAGRQSVQPVFLPVTQVGGTVQAVLSSWVLKLEWAHRSFGALDQGPWGRLEQPDHWQVAWGLEYSRSLATGATGTAVLEGQTFTGVSEAERARLGSFQNDLLVGYRHDFNDVQGRQLRASLTWDVERSHEIFFSFVYSQRLSDVLSLETGLRIFDAPAKGPSPVGLERLDGADELRLKLIRRF